MPSVVYQTWAPLVVTFWEWEEVMCIPHIVGALLERQIPLIRHNQKGEHPMKRTLFWICLCLVVMLILIAAQVEVTAAESATPVPTPAATPTPEPPPGATRVREADGAVMVYVPAGEFPMGNSIFEGAPSEWPQRIIYLDGFWVDRTEVTNRQFELFVQAIGYRTRAEKRGYGAVYAAWVGARMVDGADWRHPEGPDSGIGTRGDHPVVQVDWNDAQAYCEWTGAHLPTEAEWEKACRGTDGRHYPWGSQQARGCESVRGIGHVRQCV
jgi:formylglycine-generating enzyme required for sulfatase activity